MDQTLTAARASGIAVTTKIVVIGGGQAGLSAAYHLKLRGLVPDRQFLVLDEASAASGGWTHRWPSLPLSTVTASTTCRACRFREVIGPDAADVQASAAVPAYFAAYEKRFELPVYRPVT